MVDDRKEIGVDDGVRKLGSDVEDKEKFVSVVKSDLEDLESGVDSEKVKEKSEGNEVGNGFADDGMNDSENTQGVKEFGSDDVEVNVDDNVEVGVKGGGQSDEVSELKGVDVEEVVKEKGLSDAGEDNKKMAPNGREEVVHEEVNATGEFQRLNKPFVQQGADTQDEEVQIDEVPTVVAEHSAVEKIQHLEEPVWHERTGTHDAEVQTDDAATGMTEHNSCENMENVPLDLTSPVKDNADHTDNLELPVPSECQAEAVLTEGTVNGVLGAADTLGKSNAIIENYGDKLDVLSEVDFDTDVQPENGMSQMEWTLSNEQVDDSKSNHFVTPENKNQHVKMEDLKADEEKLNSSLYLEGDESGTEEERIAFFREVETFFKARGTDFRAPKFYGEPLNLLKLWRAVIRLGGYEQVTSCKLWRQIGESFNPPKTCTTVSWTFRLFYEKALLEFERHKMRDGDLPYDNSFTEFDTETQNGVQTGGSQGLGSGRVMRDSAARAMQGWHSQRSLSNGEIGDPTIMDKSLSSTLKREKHTKSHDFASLKRKTTYPIEQPSKLARSKPHMEISVIDAGEAANWVKINIRKTKDCFEIYALVPGLTREEVRVQSDPAGRLVISGEPQQLDNPWGVTPFKKVVSLPSRIDPHQTSAVVTLHGQLFVRVPFKQLDGE